MNDWWYGGCNGTAIRTYRWVELYEFHDKYTFVGVTAETPVEDVVARAMLEHAAIQALQQQQSPQAGADEEGDGEVTEGSTAEARVAQLRADAAVRCVRGSHHLKRRAKVEGLSTLYSLQLEPYPNPNPNPSPNPYLSPSPSPNPSYFRAEVCLLDA